MAETAEDQRRWSLLRFIADHPGCETLEIIQSATWSTRNVTPDGLLVSMQASGLVGRVQHGARPWGWVISDAGRRALPAAPRAKRLTIGRRMRQAVAYVAKHEGCTKYAAGKAVTRPGHQRDGWVIVQRAIDAGLISQRKNRDGTWRLSLTERGWSA